MRKRKRSSSRQWQQAAAAGDDQLQGNMATCSIHFHFRFPISFTPLLQPLLLNSRPPMCCCFLLCFCRSRLVLLLQCLVFLDAFHFSWVAPKKKIFYCSSSQAEVSFGGASFMQNPQRRQHRRGVDAGGVILCWAGANTTSVTCR